MLSENPPLLFVVDDDPFVLRAVSRVLRLAGHAVEVFATPGLFLRYERPPQLGCLIVDLQMPEMSGLELQQALLKTGNQLPVIFLTGHGDIPTSVKALKSGAVNFLTKPVASEHLLAAVDEALSTHSRILKEQKRVAELRARFERLTARERQVCLGVGRGLLNKQIAWELGCAEKTIKLHRARVMDKLEANSVAEMVDFLRAIGEK